MQYIVPEFLTIYFENISKFAAYPEYTGPEAKWTEKIMAISQWAIYQTLLNYQSRNPKFCSDNYDPFIDTMFRVDAVGYFTKWWIENRKGMPQSYDWVPVIAFEHENSDEWNDEIGKLCHICADVKIVSSYYADSTISLLLQKSIDAFGKDMLYRYPQSKWLFIFGPRKKAGYENSFRAFIIDRDFKIVELRLNTILVPLAFKKETTKLDPPLFKDGRLSYAMSL